MKISTLTLLRYVRSTNSVSDYLERYKSEMLDEDLTGYLNELLNAHSLKIADVATRSGLNEYAYKIFSGSRTTSRINLIRIAIGMQLTLNETQKLLRVGAFALLDPRRRKDAVIIYALEKKLSLAKLELLLFEVGETL